MGLERAIAPLGLGGERSPKINFELIETRQASGDLLLAFCFSAILQIIYLRVLGA